MTVRLVHLAVFAVAIGSPACGGATSGADGGSAASAFVGTWVCTGTQDDSFTIPASTSGTSSSFSEDEVFVANADGTLTATTSASDAGTDDCPVDFSVSGSTATAVSGQTCANGSYAYAVTSETFVVSGSTATLTASATVTETTPAGTVAFSATVTSSAACQQGGG